MCGNLLKVRVRGFYIKLAYQSILHIGPILKTSDNHFGENELVMVSSSLYP